MKLQCDIDGQTEKLLQGLMAEIGIWDIPELISFAIRLNCERISRRQHILSIDQTDGSMDAYVEDHQDELSLPSPS